MCDERERLIGFVYDECEDAERREIEAHLGSCEVCRTEIHALRSVREDLLAWDVPDHGSVWRPFVPMQRTAWWRQVPAWAMAAAAGLVFAVGAAGGAVTATVMGGRPDAVGSVVAQAPAREVTDTDLIALENRLRSSLTELDARVAISSPSAPAPVRVAVTDPRLARQTAQLTELLRAQGPVNEYLDSQIGDLRTEVKELRRLYEGLDYLLSARTPAGSAGGGVK